MKTPNSFYTIQLQSCIGDITYYLQAKSIGDGLSSAAEHYPNSKVVGVFVMKPTAVPESEWKR